MSPIKPTLVIIPGFMGQPEDWTWLVQALEAQVTCLVVDLGAFASPIPTASTDDDRFLLACHGLFDQFDRANRLPERFALLGYSMGGRIAMAWAKRFPERLTHLVLESCHPGLLLPEERVERQQSDKKWADRFQSQHLTSVLTAWYQQGVFAHLNTEQRRQRVLQRVTQSKVQTPQQIAAQLMTFSLGWQPYLGQLPAIPTTYLCGALDAKFVAIGTQLSAQNSHLALYQMPDSGHNVHQETPQAYLACIQALLV